MAKSKILEQPNNNLILKPVFLLTNGLKLNRWSRGTAALSTG